MSKLSKRDIRALLIGAVCAGASVLFVFGTKWLGRWIDTPIVDDVKQRPPRQISWHLHGRSHFTAQTRKEDRDPELVLRNITLQTNLEFIKEARPVKTLFVKRDG